MASPRLNKTDQEAVDTFGFSFEEPPEKSGSRQSKHDERFAAAREMCLKFPGKTLKVITYDKPSMPYTIAKSINNGEHRSFKDDSADWLAVAGKEYDENEDVTTYSVWLTYNGTAE